MWFLLYISLVGEPQMTVLDRFKTISQCFDHRDAMLVAMEMYEGRFPEGTTAICVYKKGDKL